MLHVVCCDKENCENFNYFDLDKFCLLLHVGSEPLQRKN